MKHDNWRNYTHDDVDLVFMHPDNQWDAHYFKAKLYNYMADYNKTLGQMAEEGPRYWLKDLGIGQKSAIKFVELINNLAGKTVVRWNIGKVKSPEFDAAEEAKKNKLKAALYKMRLETSKSWKEIGLAFGVTATTARRWDKEYRIENNLSSKYVDNLGQRLIETRKKFNELKQDMFLLARYLQANGHSEVAHLIEKRLLKGRGS